MAHDHILRAPDALEHDDASLVARVLDGDRWAKEMLFRRHVESIGALIVHLLQNRAEAEDVVQDAFIAAFEDLPKLRDPDAFRAWLTRIAVRKTHRRFRRNKLLRRLGLLGRKDEVTLDQLAAPNTTPDQRAELALITKRLDELATNERIAWTLRYVEGASIREVADACGCSESTAKRRIRSAHDRLGLNTNGGPS